MQLHKPCRVHSHCCPISCTKAKGCGVESLWLHESCSELMWSVLLDGFVCHVNLCFCTTWGKMGSEQSPGLWWLQMAVKLQCYWNRWGHCCSQPKNPLVSLVFWHRMSVLGYRKGRHRLAIQLKISYTSFELSHQTYAIKQCCCFSGGISYVC